MVTGSTSPVGTSSPTSTGVIAQRQNSYQQYSPEYNWNGRVLQNGRIPIDANANSGLIQLLSLLDPRNPPPSTSYLIGGALQNLSRQIPREGNETQGLRESYDRMRRSFESFINNRQNDDPNSQSYKTNLVNLTTNLRSEMHIFLEINTRTLN